jgi:uncharacterized membrane protein YkoI
MKLLLAITALVTVALAAETKVKFQDLPSAVQQAVKQQSQGATVRGYSKEVEHGKTIYEAELTVNGHTKDVSFDASGNVVSVEEEVAIASIPAAARDAILKAAAPGRVKVVELVTENGISSYEAAIVKRGKTSEVKVDAGGKPVK